MMDLRGATWFRLSPPTVAYGLACDEHGAFLGPIPLVSSQRRGAGEEVWSARPISELNRELSTFYGVPVDLTPKAKGLATIAGAFNDGNLAKAQIAALHLHLPDLPLLAKGARTNEEITALAIQLCRTGILKGTFDPKQHPRWPSNAPGSQGGQFRDANEADGETPADAVSPVVVAADLPSTLGSDSIPENLPSNVKKGLEFLRSKLIEAQNAQYREFYNKWKLSYSDSPPDFGPAKHSLGQTTYSPDGSVTVFYPDVAKGWTPEKYRFFVAHEFAHTLPENAATPPRERERNANEIAARITGIPIPEEFRSYAKRTTTNAPRS
jgi:hypothetical protein